MRRKSEKSKKTSRTVCNMSEAYNSGTFMAGNRKSVTKRQMVERNEARGRGAAKVRKESLRKIGGEDISGRRF